MLLLILLSGQGDMCAMLSLRDCLVIFWLPEHHVVNPDEICDYVGKYLKIS